MDLFKKLNEVLAEGMTLTITVAQKGEHMTVNVLPGNSLVKDSAKNNIIPFTVTGTAEELDEGFVDAISAPIASTAGLLSNMADYEKAEAEAKQKSQMLAKQKEEAAKRKADFEAYMKLSQTNLDEHKFRDARTCLEAATALANTDDMSKKVADMEAAIITGSGENSIFGAITDKSDGKNVKIKAAPAGKKPAPSCETNEEDNEEE